MILLNRRKLLVGDFMIKAIVYNSNTGHTEEYAKILSEKINVPYYDIKTIRKELRQNDEIIYLGWICASRICGINKVTKKYKVKCCGAVGAYAFDEKYIQEIKKGNKLEIPLFYLRGGINYKKLKGIKKKVFQMFGNAMEKENRPENRELINLLKNGGNYVSEKNLEQLITYIMEELEREIS